MRDAATANKVFGLLLRREKWKNPPAERMEFSRLLLVVGSLRSARYRRRVLIEKEERNKLIRASKEGD